MSKYDIRSQFECQNRILNVKIRYLAKVRMSKYDSEYQNTIFGPISPDFECQNRILNDKIRFSAQF